MRLVTFHHSGRRQVGSVLADQVTPLAWADAQGEGALSLACTCQPRLEPEVVFGLKATPPADSASAGADLWSLRAFRELDDALLRLRFDYPEVAVVQLRTRGDRALVIAHDEALAKDGSGFAREVRLLQRRVLKRLDNTARSLYAVADTADSCFAGVLLETALAADRFYMLIDGAGEIAIATSVANAGANPTATGLTRLEARFYGEPGQVAKVLGRGADGPIASEDAEALGVALARARGELPALAGAPPTTPTRACRCRTCSPRSRSPS